MWVSSEESKDESDYTPNKNSEQSSTSTNTNEKPIKTNPKPPPIFVEQVELITPLTTSLDEVANSSYQHKILKNNEVKIQPSNSATFSFIVDMLKSKKSHFFTFKPSDCW